MKKCSIVTAFDKFKPESCVFVISVDEKGKPGGMVASWHMKCSLSPALFAVALSKEGNTHKLIRKSREFVIAVPNKSLEKEVRFFGSTHGDKVDKFRETGIEILSARFVRPPLIKNATINFECRLVNEVSAGDHFVFIGRILASYINSKKNILFNMRRVKGQRVFKEISKE